MELAFQGNWLEDAIGIERDPAKIADAIARNPQFVEVIRESVEFAAKVQEPDKTRVIAEHIACLIKSGFNGFVTMH